MIQYDPILSNLIQHDPTWSNIIQSDPARRDGSQHWAAEGAPLEEELSAARPVVVQLASFCIIIEETEIDILIKKVQKHTT